MGKRHILAFVATLFLIGLNSSCRNSSDPIPIVPTPTASDNVTVLPIPKEQLLELDSVHGVRASLSTVTSVPMNSTTEADSKRKEVHLSSNGTPTIVPTVYNLSGQGLENRVVPTPTPPNKLSVSPTKRPVSVSKASGSSSTSPSNNNYVVKSVKTPVPTTSPVSVRPSSSPTSNVKKLPSTAVPTKTIPDHPKITPIQSTPIPTQPMQTPTLPTQTPTLPTQTPTLPTRTPTLPTQTLTLPTATPYPPTLTPSLPTATPYPPTPTPSLPTATPYPPTPTPKPLTGDPRFGLVAHTKSRVETRYFLEELGVNWYLNFSPSLDQIPSGANKVAFIQVPGDSIYWNSGDAQSVASLTDTQRLERGFTTQREVEYMATMAPGSYWYIFGEPNRYGFITPERFISVFHYYVTIIKSYDPSAKIVGTSMLNWDHTCIGCSGTFQCETVPRKGYMCGKVWFKRFIAAYELEYGYKPQVDAWGIDLYPLDWSTFGANSEIHASIVISQLVSMRAYLDTLQEYLETPLWITEIAVHRGYDCGANCRSWTVDPSGNGLLPLGVYRWDKMSDFMLTVLDWLETNATDYKIEKWFFFVSWRDIVSASTDGYMGIILFDGPTQSSGLNCLGEAYRSRALQYLTVPPVRLKCDESGLSLAE